MRMTQDEFDLEMEKMGENVEVRLMVGAIGIMLVLVGILWYVIEAPL